MMMLIKNARPARTRASGPFVSTARASSTYPDHSRRGRALERRHDQQGAATEQKGGECHIEDGVGLSEKGFASYVGTSQLCEASISRAVWA